LSNGNDLEMDLVFKANAESVSHTIKNIENEMARFQKRIDSFKGLAKMSLAPKDLEEFRRVNNQIVKQGADVFKGLKAHRDEYIKMLKKGDLEKAYGGLIKKMEELEEKTRRSKKGIHKYSDDEKDVIRRFQAATTVMVKAHRFRSSALESIATREAKVRGIQLRQSAAAARRQREIEERADRESDRRERAREAKRSRRYRYLTKFDRNRDSEDRLPGERNSEFVLRQYRRRKAQDRQAGRHANYDSHMRQWRTMDRQAGRHANFDGHVKAWRGVQRDQERATNGMWAALKGQISMRDRSARQEAAQLRAEEVARKRSLREHMAFQKNKMAANRHALESDHEYALRMERRRIGLRRQLHRAGHGIMHNGHRAVSSMSHPFLSSPAFLAEASLVGALVGLRETIEKASTYDKAVTDLSIRGNMSYADASLRGNAAQHLALRYGTSAEHLVNIEKEALSRGILPDLAKEIGPMVLKYAEATGQKPEEAADHASEFAQQLLSMHKIDGIGGVHQVMNTAAALGNQFGGSEKMTQAFENGLAERGAALGLNPKDTLTLAALMNSMGVRSGRYTTTAMGELAQGSPKWADQYQQKLMSGGSTPQDRLFLSAPRLLGYGNIKSMQADAGGKHGIDGIVSFLQSFARIEDESKRNQLEEQLGLGEQLRGIIQAFLSSPEKLDRARGVANGAWGQRDGAGDYLTEAQKKQRQSLEYATGVMDSAFESISIGIEKGVKGKVLLPFVKSWEKLGDWSIDHLPKMVDGIIDGFVAGLGYRNFAGKASVQAMIDDIQAQFGRVDWRSVGRDIAIFIKGVGEGFRTVASDIRWVFDKLRAVTGAFGDGGLETLGRLTVEIGAFALALHAFSPVMGVISSVVASFRLMRGILTGMRTLASLSGGGGLVTLGSTLMSVASGLGAIAVAIEGLMAAGVLQHFTMPWANTDHPIEKFLWGTNPDGTSARPAWAGGPSGPSSTTPTLPSGAPNPTAQTPSDYWARKNRYLHPSSFEGGDDPNNWRNLLTKASYEPSDAGQVARGAMVDTARGISDVKAEIEQTNALLKNAFLSGGGLGGSGGGFGGGGGGSGAGGGTANMRYGHSAAGGWNSTPGTGSFGNPSKSLLDFIAQSEGTRGYNTSLGFGKYLPGGKEQNLTGMSLNQILALGDGMRRMPGNPNSSALGRYQITGQTIRDLMKRMGLNGSEKFDEKMQDAMASKLIADEGPRALGRWASLKGGKMATAQGLLRSGQIASMPDAPGAPGGGGNAGKAVDIAMNMQGAGERSAQTILGAYMHPGEWCADFVNGTLKRAGVTGSGSAMASSFSGWGHHVGLGQVQKGDVIEERHGNRVGHVGLATGNVQRDRDGNVTAVQMVSGNYGHMVKTNWEKVGIIADLRRSNEAVTVAAKKVTEATKPAAIAKKVHQGINPTSGAGDGGGDGGMKPTNVNAGGHHFEMHFHHQVSDPDQHARAVLRHIENHIDNRAHDVDYNTV
jgi:hypothetical protein